MAVAAFLRPHVEQLAGDYDVFVVSNYSGEEFPSEQGNYLHVPLVREISPLKDLQALWALFRIFRRYRFDVVHSVTPKAGLLAMLAAWLAGVPIRIHWFTGQVWVTRTGLARIALKSADRLIVAMASHLLADSPSQRDFLVSESVCRPGVMEVIGDGSICGVDGARFSPNALVRQRVREQLGVSFDGSLVLFLGRLNVDKGIREMAQAMRMLDSYFPRAHWLVVGPDEGGQVDYVRSLAGCLGERLHFIGFTREPELYMAAADVFCLPSYREGFGSSVLEAAAVGVPSVASRIYGLSDAVEDGVTGVLVTPGDAQALAVALSGLLGNRELRQRMGNAARTRALRLFSSERVVAGLREFYRRVLAE